jgi:hypothetical protein
MLVATVPTYSAVERHVKNAGSSMKQINIYYDQYCDTTVFGRVEQNHVFYICNPNNPTGTLWSTNDIVKFCEKYPNLVIVDEVYIDFADIESIIPWTSKLKNLIVIRSFSKAYGLAGLRLGYVVSNMYTILYLKTKYEHMHVTDIAKHYGIAVMNSLSHYKNNIDILTKNKQKISDKLKELGIFHINTRTNFMMIYVNDTDSVIDYLNDWGFIVRNMFKDYSIDRFIRINIPPSVDRLLTCFESQESEYFTKSIPLESFYTPLIYMMRLTNLLERAMSVLNANNIPYWISDGTLLGYGRNKSIIKWDIDVDISILESEEYQLLAIQDELESMGLCLIKNRFGVYWQIRNINEVMQPLDIFYKSKEYKECPNIDIFMYRVDGDKLINTDSRFVYNNPNIGKDAMVYMIYGLKDIFPTIKSKINNISVNIPRYTDRILTKSIGDYHNDIRIDRGKIHKYLNGRYVEN